METRTARKSPCDMIVSLYELPDMPALPGGVSIKRAFPSDRGAITAFIRLNFGRGWAYETERALIATPSSCFIAVEKGRVIGFATYDATALGYFGPTGVALHARGRGIGAALLVRTLYAMKERGYGYAVIGWVGSAAGFYERFVGAKPIPGGEPRRSVYKDMIAPPFDKWRE